MGYYIVMIGIMVVLSVMIVVLLDSMPDEYMDQSFIITPTDSGATTVGNMYDVLMYTVFAISSIMITIQLSGIFVNIKDSRRKDYND